VKGLVETNNIGYNSENASEPPNISTSSPNHPPELDSSNCENYGNSRHDRERHFISGSFDNNEPHIPFKDHDRKNDIDVRSDLSPISDQPRGKRRKLSSCDNPTLPVQPLSRHPSESQVRKSFDFSSQLSIPHHHHLDLSLNHMQKHSEASAICQCFNLLGVQARETTVGK
jgi:hypothetical protein